MLCIFCQTINFCEHYNYKTIVLYWSTASTSNQIMKTYFLPLNSFCTEDSSWCDCAILLRSSCMTTLSYIPTSLRNNDIKSISTVYLTVNIQYSANSVVRVPYTPCKMKSCKNNWSFHTSQIMRKSLSHSYKIQELLSHARKKI